MKFPAGTACRDSFVLQSPQSIHQCGFSGSLLVLLLNDPGGAACHHGVGGHVAHHNGPGGNHRVMTDAAALNDHGVGADTVTINSDKDIKIKKVVFEPAVSELSIVVKEGYSNYATCSTSAPRW